MQKYPPYKRTKRRKYEKPTTFSTEQEWTIGHRLESFWCARCLLNIFGHIEKKIEK